MEKNVITGQQIGLLGGPLYTTYKVLGAIKYAKEINGTHIYWMENNDADFEEINHIDYIDADNTLQTLTWDIDSQGYSCGLIAIDDSLVDLLRHFFETLRQTEFTPALKSLVLRCYVPGRTLGTASCLLASELFGHFGLELFDPSTKIFKAFIKKFLLREAARTPTGEQCNLFCMIGKKRIAVFRDEEGYSLRDGTRVNLEEYDLVPNVKTRPVCQDAFFDTHTYIAGPGEMQYIKELDPIYEFHGIRKANIIPRMSLTLLEPRAVRFMRKYDVALQDVLELEKSHLLKKVLKERSGFDEKHLRQQADQLTTEYVQALQAVGIELGKAEKDLRQAIKEEIGKQRAQEKAEMEKTLNAVGNLSDLLMPFGKKQERVFNLFYYMNLYGGLAFVDWLYERYDPSLETLEVEHA
ncbi:bacillithiol biosynthesis BshC [candidate division KSB3 bacterium]|uniref:Bacillithiol biosynthesis BshC n=1 Tax=candidate division KSB3 bacterium TaxID=2044937 RepID=A0A9D5JT71_9BACT|nr:bacillithiol biosynthesis BshC [candidate division KSB3 bacterium]MBD3323527.1 bacillithiol biosynthesis BshC [candidate division KSB3 bacterium]